MQATNFNFSLIEILEPLERNNLAESIEESFSLILHATVEYPLYYQTENKRGDTDWWR